MVSLTLARATFQLKVALVSRRYSWCAPGSLGHRAETSANKVPWRQEPLAWVASPELAQQTMPARPVRGRSPPPDGCREPRGPMTKIFGTAMGGESSVGCFAPLRRQSLVSRYSNRAWEAPFGHGLHSLAGPLQPQGHDAHRSAERQLSSSLSGFRWPHRRQQRVPESTAGDGSDST